MAQKYKIRTPQEYAAAQERTAAARTVIRESGLLMSEVCYHLGRSYQSLSTWLRAGLDSAQYDRILAAVAAGIDARDGRKGR